MEACIAIPRSVIISLKWLIFVFIKLYNKIKQNIHQQNKSMMLSTEEAILQRSTCKYYDSNDCIVDEKELKKILALTQRAPTCFNSQPWISVVVRRDSPENSKLVESSFASNQQRVKNAAATIVFCADLEPVRNLDRMADLISKEGHDGQAAKSKMKKALTIVACHVQPFKLILSIVKAIVLPIVGFFTPVMTGMIGESTRTWSIKQTMFAASTFLIASTSFGYDTTPMEGFDSNRVRKAIGVSKRYVPALLVCIGKSETTTTTTTTTTDNKKKSKGLRFSTEEVYFDGNATKPFEGIDPAVKFPSSYNNNNDNDNVSST